MPPKKRPVKKPRTNADADAQQLLDRIDPLDIVTGDVILMDFSKPSGVHCILTELMQHFQDEGDSEACQLVASLGEHVYKKAANAASSYVEPV